MNLEEQRQRLINDISMRYTMYNHCFCDIYASWLTLRKFSLQPPSEEHTHAHIMSSLVKYFHLNDLNLF